MFDVVALFLPRWPRNDSTKVIYKRHLVFSRGNPFSYAREPKHAVVVHLPSSTRMSGLPINYLYYGMIPPPRIGKAPDKFPCLGPKQPFHALSGVKWPTPFLRVFENKYVYLYGTYNTG